MHRLLTEVREWQGGEICHLSESGTPVEYVAPVFLDFKSMIPNVGKLVVRGGRLKVVEQNAEEAATTMRGPKGWLLFDPSFADRAQRSWRLFACPARKNGSLPFPSTSSLTG